MHSTFQLLYTCCRETVSHKALIYYDPEQTNSRYIVVFYEDGKHVQSANYHTDDLIDAWNTAGLQLLHQKDGHVG